uniref:hypothetical protein n=1 Tax=Enterobacter cloacae TaxID=550 RepID=UPI000BB6BA0C|nr:hypothetical protein [Enterobacter cloacae]
MAIGAAASGDAIAAVPIERKTDNEASTRYSYPQLTQFKSAKAPGQNSIGTGGQFSIGANTAAS